PRAPPAPAPRRWPLWPAEPHPAGLTEVAALEEGRRFTIQQHHARRLHHDVRFERDGVLVSFAVPKRLPEEPGVRHLAVNTEDHPLDYLTFGGTIPAGGDGGGRGRAAGQSSACSTSGATSRWRWPTASSPCGSTAPATRGPSTTCSGPGS